MKTNQELNIELETLILKSNGLIGDEFRYCAHNNAITNGAIMHCVPDYCDSWEHVGHLIEEHMIPVKPIPKGTNEFSLEDTWVAGRHGFLSINKNPRRAVVECAIKKLKHQLNI